MDRLSKSSTTPPPSRLTDLLLPPIPVAPRANEIDFFEHAGISFAGQIKPPKNQDEADCGVSEGEFVLVRVEESEAGVLDDKADRGVSKGEFVLVGVEESKAAVLLLDEIRVIGAPIKLQDSIPVEEGLAHF